MKPRRLILPAALSLGVARGHSYINSFVVDGVLYGGFIPENHNQGPVSNNPDVLAAWSTEVLDDGWVGELDYASPDIVCNLNALNPNGNVAVEAGDSVMFLWNGWPESHHGPILTYMAYCGEEADSCLRANKAELEFFGIDAVGLIDPTTSLHDAYTAFGIWATDILIHTNHTYTVQIPPTLSPGNYVVRHEIIALHYALKPDLGPQHYPQCINLVITGSGTEKPEGHLGTELYRLPDDEAGLKYDISQDPLPPYTMPGPGLIAGAVPSAVQDQAHVTASGEATPAEATS
ncbi:related to endoglucanase IV precursor [Cephalotrichum gorgonifer]|uniref:lytic cellulose monooxygenase (C4-dehydrogenating) n=1 Tax=Cephalotrichum gorgonifer TaxID=2041049 RepID=A0AAE8N3V5_9PEZI|nr:related to endoglucanase IV precursor [Cephalotrichum gorgonifer]